MNKRPPSMDFSSSTLRLIRLAVLTCALLTCLSFVDPLAAQVPTPTPMSPMAPMAADITDEEIAAKIETIRAATDLSDDEKSQLVALYTQAQQALKKLVQSRDETARFNDMVSGVEKERERLDAALTASADPVINVPTNASRNELEQLKTDADTTEQRLKQQLTVWENELTRRQTRTTEIPNEIATIRTELDKVKNQLSEPPATNEKPVATQARQTFLAAQQLYLTQKLAALEAEQQAYPATSSLVPKQQELARKEYKSYEAYRKALEEQIRIQIAKETQEKVEEAEAREEQTLAELRPLAEEVREIIEEYQEQMRVVSGLDSTLAEVQTKIKTEEDEFEKRKTRIETLGLTNALGRLLREKKGQLTRQRLTTVQLRRANTGVRDMQEKILSLAELRNDLFDSEAETRTALINEVLQSYPDIDPQEVQTEVDTLLRAKLDNLALLQTAYQSTFEKMVAVDSTRLEFIRLIDDHLDYINERVLWIRSDSLISNQEIKNLRNDLKSFLGWERWLGLWNQLKGEHVLNIVFVILLTGLIGLMVFYRPRVKRLLVKEGVSAAKRNCREFGPTLKATLLTLFLTALWPALIALVGIRLRLGSDRELFGYALGTATLETALFALPFEWIRHLVRPSGLGESHFGMSAAVRSLLRFHARMLTTFGAVLFWLVAANLTLENGSADWTGTFGRFALLVLLGMILLSFAHLLRPRSGLIAVALADQHKQILYRLRYLIFAATVLIIPTLITLMILGFYFISVVLAIRLFYTICLLVAVISLVMLIRRWLLVRRRRLAMKQYRERMEKQRERIDSGAVAGEVLPFDIPDEAVVDLAALNEQTMRLFRGAITLLALAALWSIWNDIIPALNQFGRFALWKVAIGSDVIDVTLGHAVLAVLVFALTFFASKNVPALLEMFLLQQLPFDSGARFAITTITRYLIVIVGVLVGLSMVKVQWSQYSWLIAGAGVGLGFGMQEIFANFISGLIVLLERPCRVGDVVTVGDVTGVVSRIQIRATTVTNWDRQELIVPNKEFVTGRLLNWTLSSSVNRVTIPVGIAYGSDTRLATELLTQVVQSNPNVLDEPAPMVTFENFGASSLDFTIRCYLPSLDNRLGTIHELHSEIDRVFRENQIEIAFPQQDLHIRSMSGDVARRLAEGFLVSSSGNGRTASSSHNAAGLSDGPR